MCHAKGMAAESEAKSTRLGIVTVVVASTLWGLGTVATDAILHRSIPVSIFTFIEIASSILFLLIVLVATGTRLPRPRHCWRAGATGLLNPAATYLLLNTGLSRTSVTHAALIQTLEPVLIAGMSWLLFRHAVPRRVLVPMVAVLGGSALVVTAHAAGGTATTLGDIFIVLGVVTAALYSIASTRIEAEIPALAAVFVQLCVAFVIITPLAAAQLIAGHGHITGPHGTWTFATQPLITWVATPVVGVTSTAIAFWCFLIALRNIPAATAGQFLAIIPVVGFLGAIFVLHEPVTLQGVVGGLVVVVSLVLIARGEQQAEQAYRASHPPEGPKPAT